MGFGALALIIIVLVTRRKFIVTGPAITHLALITVMAQVIPFAIFAWAIHHISSIAAGLLTFWRAGAIERWRNPVQSIDALGLGVFAVAGALKAQAFGLGPVGAMLLGMLTGIGGGMIRDVLVAQVPTVLKAELYAIAALAGAGVVVLGTALSLPVAWVVGAGLFVLAMVALRSDGWFVSILFVRPPARR